MYEQDWKGGDLWNTTQRLRDAIAFEIDGSRARRLTTGLGFYTSAGRHVTEAEARHVWRQLEAAS